MKISIPPVSRSGDEASPLRGRSRRQRRVFPLMLAIAAACTCGASSTQAATLKVDRRGQTPGAYATIAQATAAVRAGDTIELIPGSGPYREMLDIKALGTKFSPIIFEGNGETVTAAETFKFTFNSGTAQWEYVLPVPISNQATGSANTFRHLVTYRGQRLLLDRVGGGLTSDLATLSENGLKLILGDASPTEGWEIGVRPIAVRISGAVADPEPVPWHHVYRNLRVTGARNDGFNLHGTGTDVHFENIEAFNNFDEGFSAHDAIHCSINGGAFWGNDNGLYNESSSAIAIDANDIQAYANLGSGISMRQGASSLTNSQAWDNGILNIALGGTFTAHSVTTYHNRWPQPPFVAYQETQGQPLGAFYPYTYDAFWKGNPADALHQAYELTGEEPDVRGVTRLPPFALAYADWRFIYFAPDQIADPATSSPDVDPDGDGQSNQDEYLLGLRPLTADSPRVIVSVTVPDHIARTVQGDTGRILVNRSGPTDSALTVYYTMGGSATAETDYAALGNSVQIPAGSKSAELIVVPVNDGVADVPKLVVLALTDDPAYLIGPATGTVNLDPVDLPVLTLSVPDASASELDGENGRMRLRRSGSTAAPLQVDFSVGGSATPGDDYAGFGNSVEFPVGVATLDFVVNAVDDGLTEEAESVVLTLRGAPAYQLASSIGVVTIEGLPLATITLVATDASANEAPGNPGSFTVSRSSGEDALRVYFTLAGTATAGADYGALGNSVLIPAGSASATILVLPVDDGLAESSESVVLNLANQTTYVLGSPRSGTVTITNYTPPSVSVTTIDPSASEVGENVGVFSVARTGPKTEALQVRYSMSGSAIAGTDYAALSGTLEIPIGSGSATVTVTPLPDTSVEGDETAVLNLVADPAYLPGTGSSGTVNIADAVLPTISVTTNDNSASEAAGNSGLFTISRTGSKTASLTVWFGMSGSASAGADYTDPGVSAVIAAGTSQATISIEALPDGLVEGSESAVLSLLAQPHYVVGASASGTVNIADVAAVTVSITASDAVASESGSDPGAFTISRSGSTANALSVAVMIGGTATSGTDYIALESPVTIPAGSASVVVVVTPRSDALAESAETVSMTLVSSAGYQPGSSSAASVTIFETAPVTVSLSVTDANASEAAGNTGAYTLTRSGSTAQALTVRYVVGGTATSAVDYASLSTSTQIPSGSDSVAILVSPIADTVAESAETVTVTLIADAAYVLGSGTSGTVNIANAAVPVVTLAVVDSSASEAAGNGGLFTATRTGAVTAPLTLRLGVAGTATPGTDYAALSGTVVIPAGSRTANVAVSPQPDALVEGSETVTLSIEADEAYALGAVVAATVNIADVPLPVVTLSVSDAAAAEFLGNPGEFTLTRTGSRTVGLTVYFTVAGTATAGQDYTEIGLQAEIPAGVASVRVTVSPLADALVEDTETIVMNLVSQPNYALGSAASGTVSIADAM